MDIDINISYELSIVVDFTDWFSYLDFIDCTGPGYSWLFGTPLSANWKDFDRNKLLPITSALSNDVLFKPIRDEEISWMKNNLSYRRVSMGLTAL